MCRWIADTYQKQHHSLGAVSLNEKTTQTRTHNRRQGVTESSLKSSRCVSSTSHMGIPRGPNQDWKTTISTVSKPAPCPSVQINTGYVSSIPTTIAGEKARGQPESHSQNKATVNLRGLYIDSTWAMTLYTWPEFALAHEVTLFLCRPISLRHISKTQLYGENGEAGRDGVNRLRGPNHSSLILSPWNHVHTHKTKWRVVWNISPAANTHNPLMEIFK